MSNMDDSERKIVAIASFRPKDKNPQLLIQVLREHDELFLHLGFITTRQPYILESANGIILHIFEWISAEAIEKAHENAQVLALWKRYEELCDYVLLKDINECGVLFPGFTPL